VFNLFFIFYFGILAITSVLAFLSYKKGDRKSIFLLILLIATIVTELSSLIITVYQIDGYTFRYYIFNLIEYTLLCMYYLKSCTNKKCRIGVRISIVLFLFFVLYTAIFITHFKGLPALNIDIEGFLLFMIYTQLLFSIDIPVEISIYLHPDFWISVGILIFYGGIFVFSWAIPSAVKSIRR